MVSPLQITQPGVARTRKMRKPRFDIAGTMKPFGLYPMWVTPVLPGETLRASEMKYRLLSMPIKHPLAGAWFETFLVYVPLTAMDDNFAAMFISEDVSPTSYQADADRPRYFTRTGQIDYIKMAMDVITTTYFRAEEEPDALTRVIDGVNMASRLDMSWAQNLMFQPENMDASLLPSALPEEGTYTPLEIMRMAGMSELTYEKYLQQYGVSQKAAIKAEVKAEILRYTRDWTVPTNTVEPSTGRPSSCWAWSATIKGEKAKRFDEPGFIIQVGCCRPKLLDRSFKASMAGDLWGFADWFPVYNLTDPAAGIKVLNTLVVDRPQGASDPLIYDHRDLLSHGEPFVNDWSGPYRLPEITARDLSDGAEWPDLRGLYPTEEDLEGLFVEADEEEPDDARMRLYYEGIAECDIVGHVVDTTK